ncbi:MAG: hypothetical protein CMF17_10425 [Idiomarinaceae bacterium]|nr:hypothetical protein [Idiomarinaceae bacterium]
MSSKLSFVRIPKFVQHSFLVLLLAVTVVSAFYQKREKLPAIQPQTGQNYICEAPFSDNDDTFDVYVTDKSVALMSIERFCSNKVVRRQFGNVNVILGQNDYDTFRYINHGVVDLALVKSNVVEAFGADSIYGYENIASHPDYSAYFIALKEKPELSKEYLLGKQIGILDYPSSRSGHIVPKTVLKSLNLSDNNVELNYYNSHVELRRALLAGEVDIISSYWGKGDDEILSKNYITSLHSGVSGMRWYLKMQTRNTDLRCATQQVIKQIAASHPRAYYQRVDLEQECGSE